MTNPVVKAFPERADFDSHALAFCFDYWWLKRASRAMPSRADIEPNELKPCIANVVLLDVLPDKTDLRFRLIGSKIADYMFADATGSTTHEAYERGGMLGACAQTITDVHRIVCGTGMPYHVKVPPNGSGSTFHPAMELLYLPLSDDGVNVNMILAAVTFDDGLRLVS